MKQSIILSAIGATALSAAHGIVIKLDIGGTVYPGYNPMMDQYMNPVPKRIVWAFPSAFDGPVEDVTTSDIVCNKGATAALISATVAAGSKVEFTWNTWPESHKGPVMTYLGNCNGDCSAADATTIDFFKIDEAGYNGTTWASDTFIAAGLKWTVTLPSDIAAGNYLLRHELLALHAAESEKGAQFYPMCANLVITGGGSAAPAGVNFPGAYSATDPGILVEIGQGMTSYTIPGPAVYTGGAGVSDPITTSAATVPTTTSASAVTAPTTADSTAATSTIAKPTITAPTISLATTAPVATTSASTLRTVTCAAATAATNNSSQTVNECLDAVNACIRSQ